MATTSAPMQSPIAGAAGRSTAQTAGWQGSSWREWEGRAAIDAEMLERLARIARGLPGHVISVDAHDRAEADLTPPTAPPEDGDPVVRIDGVVAREILEHYQQLLELG